jgi:glycerophosphoryl diester phosphodiesterase
MWSYPHIIAHRGGGTLAPENTMAAMRCGLARGFRAVEFDVMLSQDGIPMVLHDPVLGRTVAGVGNVSDHTAQQLAGMDAGSWFGTKYCGERVPTFEQIARFCIANNIWMNVEIKPAPGLAGQTGKVVGEITRRLFRDAIADADLPAWHQASLPLFSSFSFEALLAAKAAVPEIPRGFLANPIPVDWRQRLEQLEAVALHTNHITLSPTQVTLVKSAGYGLLCYTVNQPARAREIMAWGVDALCTDRLDLIGPEFS